MLIIFLNQESDVFQSQVVQRYVLVDLDLFTRESSETCNCPKSGNIDKVRMLSNVAEARR
jgi:hypothetical protein